MNASNSAFTWPGGARAAISLTFDDARPTQLDVGMPILDATGAKASFYVSLGPLEARLGEWQKAAHRGHEIGNHSIRHPCSGNFRWSRKAALEEYTLEQMDTELREASERIRTLVGVAPTTFAYPCGQIFIGRGEHQQSYVPVVARQFLAGRNYNAESCNDPLYCDLAHVAGRPFDEVSWDALAPWLEQAAQEGSWLVLVGHGVGTGGRQTVLDATLQKLCELCRRDSTYWLATVDAVATHITRTRDSMSPLSAIPAAGA